MEKSELEQPTTVDSKTVSCDGGNGSSGHPHVYLNIGDKNKISCPYCSRLFVFETVSVEGEGH